MNAAELLNRLVSRGVAREASPGPGARRAVRYGDLEVAWATQDSDRSMRAKWKERVKNSQISYLLLADDAEHEGSVRVLGPSVPDEPVRSADCEGLAQAIERAASMRPLEAVRHVAAEVVRLSGRGMLVHGLLSRHVLERRLHGDPEFAKFASSALETLSVGEDWRTVPSLLGYGIETLPHRGYLLRHADRPVAVVHPKADPREFMRMGDDCRPPEGVLAAECRKRGARYGILAWKNRYRLFDCHESASASEWLDLDASLLRGERRNFLALLSPRYLAQDGFVKLQEEAQAFGSALRSRLDLTIRQDALPALALGLKRWASKSGRDLEDSALLDELQRAALTLLFRLLFVLYAESSRFLPMDDATYRRHSLVELVTEASRTRGELSEASTGLWSNFGTLVRALRSGNPGWGVPAYNGALFSDKDFEGAELLEQIEIDDPNFADVLMAVGLDSESQLGIDYSSLEVAHLGHIYETLLSLRLSVADRPLRYDSKKDRYVSDATDPELEPGSLLWQTDEGGRKAGGVYYTPAPLVDHLVRQAVLPKFCRHLADVRLLARGDPAAAADLLLDFAVLDPACGSAHFLVAVLDVLAERTVAFLADTPLPAIKATVDRLRTAARQGSEVTDVALLRRLLLKHCVYGADVSPMGAEIATLSLWLTSFVPGLSLAYLGRNVVVGNALIGVASAESVVPEGALQSESLSTALAEASEAAMRVARIDDRTPEEVEASRVADLETTKATAGLRRLFDLWTAEGFGLAEARFHAENHGPDVLNGNNGTGTEELVARATALGAEHRFLHWPLEFPRTFAEGRKGFDAVVGNPPWEEVTVEKLAFLGLRSPGIRGLPSAKRQAAVRKLLADRPELGREFQTEQARAKLERQALASGEYESMKGDPDLYKYFCQRYRRLVREGGMVGVVLPGSTRVNKGSMGFREWLFSETTTRRIDSLINKGCWAFDSEPRYGVALVTAERTPPPENHHMSLAGVAASLEDWRSQASSDGVSIQVASLGSGHLVPRLRSQAESELLSKLRVGTPFPMGAGHGWKCFPVRELDETNDAVFWRDVKKGLPLWKGESFDQYDPHGAEGRWCAQSDELTKKIQKQRPGHGSVVAELTAAADRRQAVLKELGHARVAFRDVSRSDDSRTMRACLVPLGVLLTNKAPYLAFVEGDELEQAACLGVMNSLPFDWQTRRFVEANMNFFLLESFVVPDLEENDFMAVGRAAGRLSASDARFAGFAEAVGVEHGRLEPEEHERLRLDIDARIARSWHLTEADLETMFLDFSRDALPEPYRGALLERFRELG